MSEKDKYDLDDDSTHVEESKRGQSVSFMDDSSSLEHSKKDESEE